MKIMTSIFKILHQLLIYIAILNKTTAQAQPSTTNTTTVPTTATPSFIPTGPVILPSLVPTLEITSMPTSQSSSPAITELPTTSSPTTPTPTIEPTIKTEEPTSFIPSLEPTSQPKPTAIPTMGPSLLPTVSYLPTIIPTCGPSVVPSVYIKVVLTNTPSNAPTYMPSNYPSTTPTYEPSYSPSETPTYFPSEVPTIVPSIVPSVAPTFTPSTVPTFAPTSVEPTTQPTFVPSSPTFVPSIEPSFTPTSAPSVRPTSSCIDEIDFSGGSRYGTFIGLCHTWSFPWSEKNVSACGYNLTNNVWVPVELSIKKVPVEIYPNEEGLGLSTGEKNIYEIGKYGLAQFNVSSIFQAANPQFMIGSTDNTENYCIYGSQQDGVLGTLLYTSAVEGTYIDFPTDFNNYKYLGFKACDVNENPRADILVMKFRISNGASCTSQPTITPTYMPSVLPTYKPSCIPTFTPSRAPSRKPSCVPTKVPSFRPSVAPSQVITAKPTYFPSFTPSKIPTAAPSRKPTFIPSSTPTFSPSFTPSVIPSTPSFAPTMEPSTPTFVPTIEPSAPSFEPSSTPTSSQYTCPGYTASNTASATNPVNTDICLITACAGQTIEIGSCSSSCTGDQYIRLRDGPDYTIDVASNDDSSTCGYCSALTYNVPLGSGCHTYQLWQGCYAENSCGGSFYVHIWRTTVSPSIVPSYSPTVTPSAPTFVPSSEPSNPTAEPSYVPSFSPTEAPTVTPTYTPSIKPSKKPSVMPSKKPSAVPSVKPTFKPSVEPTVKPSQPTVIPTLVPSMGPTSLKPSLFPTFRPTLKPSITPSFVPSKNPTTFPSVKPSRIPSVTPTRSLKYKPTRLPTFTPSFVPSVSFFPSCKPTFLPTLQPSYSQRPSNPTVTPTVAPSKPTVSPTVTPFCPSIVPSRIPSEKPSRRPTRIPTFNPTITFAPTISCPAPYYSYGASLRPSDRSTYTISYAYFLIVHNYTNFYSSEVNPETSFLLNSVNCTMLTSKYTNPPDSYLLEIYKQPMSLENNITQVWYRVYFEWVILNSQSSLHKSEPVIQQQNKLDTSEDLHRNLLRLPEGFRFSDKVSTDPRILDPFYSFCKPLNESVTNGDFFTRLINYYAANLNGNSNVPKVYTSSSVPYFIGPFGPYVPPIDAFTPTLSPNKAGASQFSGTDQMALTAKTIIVPIILVLFLCCLLILALYLWKKWKKKKEEGDKLMLAWLDIPNEIRVFKKDFHKNNSLYAKMLKEQQNKEAAMASTGSNPQAGQTREAKSENYSYQPQIYDIYKYGTNSNGKRVSGNNKRSTKNKYNWDSSFEAGYEHKSDYDYLSNNVMSDSQKRRTDSDDKANDVVITPMPRRGQKILQFFKYPVVIKAPKEGDKKIAPVDHHGT